MIAIAALFIVAAGVGYQADTPSGACLVEARGIADDLQASANEVAGTEFRIPIHGAHRIFGWRDMTSYPAYVAQGVVHVTPEFCAQPHDKKTLIMGHEIGHLIDYQTNPEPTASDTESMRPWSERRWEQAADAYGHRVMDGVFVVQSDGIGQRLEKRQIPILAIVRQKQKSDEDN